MRLTEDDLEQVQRLAKYLPQSFDQGLIMKRLVDEVDRLQMKASQPEPPTPAEALDMLDRMFNSVDHDYGPDGTCGICEAFDTLREAIG